MTYIDDTAMRYNFDTVQKRLYNRRKDNKKINDIWKTVNSERNIIFALKRLSYNSGRNNPGPDNMIFDDIKFLDHSTLIKNVKRRLNGKVKPESRLVEIPKKYSTGKRRILISNIYDRLAQQAVYNVLEPIVEADFYDTSFGCRRNKSALPCIFYTWNSIQNQKSGEVWKGDLSSYFDYINIDYVCNFLRKNHKIVDNRFISRIKGLMRPKVNGKTKNIGLPQGSILGPLLANVFLHDLDKTINDLNGYNAAKEKGLKNPMAYYTDYSKHSIERSGIEKYKNVYRVKRGLRAVKLIRYNDDFVLVSNNMVDLDDGIIAIKDWCKKYDIKLNPKKCKRIPLKYPEDFSMSILGYSMHRRHNGRWTFGPEKASHIWKSMRKKIRENAWKKNGNKLVMSIILGYFNYYGMNTNMRWMIDRLNQLFYKWSTRHSKFTPPVEKVKGSQSYIWNDMEFNLWKMAERCRRSPKEINTEYYKYGFWDPNKLSYNTSHGLLHEYVEEVMAYGSTKQNKGLSSYKVFIPGLIYKQQYDPITGQRLDSISPNRLVVHHKKPRHLGGKNDFNNLVLISEETHKAIHHPSNENVSKLKVYPNFNLNKFNQFVKMVE